MAEMMLQTVFPDREIVKVDCVALIKQHGSLHCATMQLPAELLRI
jgi:agmatine/peptidylarginine deiminase